MASHVYTSGYSSGLLLPMGALPKDVDERRKNGVIEKNPGGRENLSFQELAEIEKERRQILLRVSTYQSFEGHVMLFFLST